MFCASQPPENVYHPFEDRLAFDWAYYQFLELKSSEQNINKGLNLWLATNLKSLDSGKVPPWDTAEEMYSTIDEIQEGNAPFQTIKFKYTGTVPKNAPAWMTQSYELCTRNIRQVLHNQLSTADFKDQFNYKPYRQFDHTGDRVWSDLFSADWAWNEAVRT